MSKLGCLIAKPCASFPAQQKQCDTGIFEIGSKQFDCATSIGVAIAGGENFGHGAAAKQPDQFVAWNEGKCGHMWRRHEDQAEKSNRNEDNLRQEVGLGIRRNKRLKLGRVLRMAQLTLKSAHLVSPAGQR